MAAINKSKAPADRIKMKIRKGETVQIISGKDKGKTGEVLIKGMKSKEAAK